MCLCSYIVILYGYSLKQVLMKQVVYSHVQVKVTNVQAGFGEQIQGGFKKL